MGSGEKEKMMRAVILACLLFFLTSVTICSAELHVYAPTSVQTNAEGDLFIELTDVAGDPVTGLSSNISCYIQNPDGTMLVDGSNPTETMQPGIYCLTFASDIKGCYPCWVTCNGAMDAGMFQVTSDVTGTNASQLSERIGALHAVGGDDRYATTQQLLYMISQQTAKMQSISHKTETFSLTDSLVQVAIGQAFQLIFWTILLSAISILGTIIYTRGRRKRRNIL